MDGVVADFEAGAALVLSGPRKTEYVQGHYRHNDSEWGRLRDEHRLYSNLPLMEHAEELVGLGRQYRDQLGWELLFLTAVPKHDDMPWAFYDKVVWAKERFPDIAVHFGPHSTDKYKHCKAGDILVDDRADNCLQWSSAGGIAVRVRGQSILPAIQVVQSDLAVRLTRKHSLLQEVQ